jgi:hypothetical protein
MFKKLIRNKKPTQDKNLIRNKKLNIKIPCRMPEMTVSGSYMQMIINPIITRGRALGSIKTTSLLAMNFLTVSKLSDRAGMLFKL